MPDVETEPGPAIRPKTTPWALLDLPPFPLVAKRLMATFARDDVDITEVGKLIAAEPVFAARVLQLANSPLFGLERQVKTISHAIILLGLDRVKAITVTSAMQDFVAPVLRVQALRVCWQNSLAGALICEKLGQANRMEADFAYVAGLLRDIGRLALLVKYPEPYANLLAVSDEERYDLMTVERELFEIDHCEAGAWLIEQLAFPPALAEAITDHHRLLDPGTFRMVHLVQCADRLADALGFGVLVEAPKPPIENVLELLPEAARARLGDNHQQWKAEITARLYDWR
jgi:HD-like signal output (HDOD) protein